MHGGAPDFGGQEVMGLQVDPGLGEIGGSFEAALAATSVLAGGGWLTRVLWDTRTPSDRVDAALKQGFKLNPETLASWKRAW
jgi:hypothetical protein